MKTSRIAILVACVLAASIAAPLSAADKSAKPVKAKRPRKVNPVFKPITDTPGLPRVLLIGDSISIGYTLATRELLKGKVNVHRIPTNGGPTTRGLTELDKWLGKGKWDVIHFNWGLHDLKYMDPKSRKLVPVSKGAQQVPIAQYEKNLVQLVKRMKKTGATLIFATTTPVPEGAAGRVCGDAKTYNAVALKVAKAHEVAVNDLYAFILPKLKTAQRRADVHFLPEGSKALATQVAKHITAALARKPAGKKPK